MHHEITGGNFLSKIEKLIINFFFYNLYVQNYL